MKAKEKVHMTEIMKTIIKKLEAKENLTEEEWKVFKMAQEYAEYCLLKERQETLESDE